MNIVLIGKNGQLGWEIQRSLSPLGKVTALGRDQLNVSDYKAVQSILKELKPNLIINATAYTEVDRAETEIELATKINSVAPGIMAEIAHNTHAVFIHYSTDYVFDGQKTTPYIEEDQTNPLNIYGKSKLMGEENIKQVGDAYFIFRTSWVYSLRGNSFVNKVLGWSRKSQNLKIVSNQVGSPTWARLLAETTSLVIATCTMDLLDNVRERRGVYHLAGSGYTSRYQWAQRILANDPNRAEQLVQTVEPVPSEEFPTPATRPMFSALNCEKIEKIFKLRLPDWEESLRLAMAGS